VVPEHLAYGGGVAETTLNPFVALIIILAGIMILVLPRNRVIVPFLAAALLIPNNQVLLIGFLHFPTLRILVSFGFLRMFWTKMNSKTEIFSRGWNKIDVILILLTVITAVNGILLWQNTGALVKQLGDLYTIFGVYFLMRFLIRDDEDAAHFIRTLAYISVPIAGIMTFEQIKGWNPYSLLGGGQAAYYSSLMIRDGRVRAMGSFGHTLLAGTYGAIIFPLFFALWWKDKKNRSSAIVGILASTVITFATVSSTPVLAYAGGILALCLWPVRGFMRLLRWGIVITLVSLHMVMKAPVWHLISRIDLTGGSSSYHRYQLIDMFIRHFSDWWLVGTKSNAEWGWDMWDTANQYVGTGEASGLVPFLLLLAILVYGFKYLGNARKAAEENRSLTLYYWALCAALFANAVAFFGISYWDQTVVVWYGFLAIINTAIVVPNRREEMQLRQVTSVGPAPSPRNRTPVVLVSGSRIRDDRPSREFPRALRTTRPGKRVIKD
jgi:hypothetical protein